MEFTNTIKITMENNDVVKTAYETIGKVLREGNYSEDYRTNTAEELANDLIIKDNQILQDKYEGYFTPEDSSIVFEDIVKAIAKIESVHNFECEIDSDSTYSESRIEATYMKGLLKITETYYPCGYVETLECEECGEEIVELEDFNPDEEYICPSCGKKINLIDQYNVLSPVIEEKEFLI